MIPLKKFKIYQEDATIFEKGGTDGATQTGEIYRAELRAIHQKGIDVSSLQIESVQASKSLNGEIESGYFFCANIAFRENDEIKSNTFTFCSKIYLKKAKLLLSCFMLGNNRML